MLRKWRSRRKKIRPPAMKSVPFQSRIGPLELLENRFAPAIVTWDGGGGDFNWNTPTNWNTDTLPGAADDVTINVAGNITVTRSSLTATINSLTCDENLTLSGGSLTINTASSVAGTLTVTAGTLTTVGTFTGTGPTVWQGGTLGGSGDFNADGGLTISTATGKFATGKRIKITVGAVWTGGDLALDEGAILEVPINQTLDGQSNNNLVRGSGLGTGTINNLGTIRKSAGGGTTTIGTNVSFANAGTVQAQNGTISLNSNGTHTGSFSISAGAILAFGGGIQVLGGASAISGAGGVSFTGGTTTVGGSFAPGGTINISGGTATINSTLAISGALNLSSGALAGTGDVSVAGAANWTGGTFGGSGQVTPLGGLNIGGGATKFLVGRLLRLGGGAVWTGGDLALDEGAILEVPVGNTLNPQGNNNLVRNSNIGPASISVTGTLAKTIGTGTTAVSSGIGFSNDGIVDVISGTLVLPSGGNHTGAFNVTAGALLEFAGGNNVLAPQSSVSGSGNLRVSGGTTTFNGSFSLNGTVSVASVSTQAIARFNVNVAIGNLSFAGSGGGGGILGGTGNITILGQTTWSAGRIEGDGFVNATSGINIASSDGKTLWGKTLTFAGSAAWTAGDIAIDRGAVLTVPAGSILDAQGDYNITRSDMAGTATLNILGTLRKSGGTGTTTIDSTISIPTAANVQVISGTLALPGTRNYSGAFNMSTGATLRLLGGTSVFTAASSISGGGNLLVSNGIAQFDGSFVTSGQVQVVTGSGLFNTSTTIGSLLLPFGGTGTVSGTGNVNVSGGFYWGGGNVSGTGTLTVAGGVVMAAGNAQLNGRTMSVSGNSFGYQGFYSITNGGALNILAGGVLEVDVLVIDCVSSSDLFNNYGTIRIHQGFANDLRLGVGGVSTGAFNNFGSIELFGSLTVNIPFNNANAMIINQTGTLILSGPGGTMTPTSTVTGSGTIFAQTGTHYFNAPTNFAGLLQFNSSATVFFNANSFFDRIVMGSVFSTITGTGNIVVNNFTYVNGSTTISGSGSLTINASSSITARLAGKTINVLGPTTCGGLSMDDGAILNISAGVVFDLVGNGGIGRFSNTGTAKVNNAGTIRKSTGGGQSYIPVALDNTGTIQDDSWFLALDTGFVNFSGTTLTGGRYIVTATGILQFLGATAGNNVVTNSAFISLSGPTASIQGFGGIDALTGFSINSANGSFTILGGKNFTSQSTFNNAGALTIGTGSIFATAAGDYIQTGGSTTVNGLLDPTGNFNLQGGVLYGSGNVAAPIVVSGSGMIAPGNSPGILNATQGIAFASGTSFVAEINGIAAGTGYDQINVSGAVTLGSAQLTVSPGFVPTLGQSFVIVNNDGTDPVSGIFAGLVEGASFTVAGVTFSISYVGGTGNDVVLTATQADLVAPYIVDIVDVAPDPRNTPVATVDVVMSEVVNLATFTSADVVLLRDGNPVAFSGNESVSFVGGMTYRINGLSEETASGGGYILIVNAAGIQDLAANQGIGAATDIWTNNNTDSTAPTILGAYFDGSAWASTFRTAAGNATYGYPAQSGAGQLTTMPWSNLNTVYVKFSENVNVDSSDLGIRGINVANYAVSSFSYDSVNFVAKWVLNGLIDTDRVIVDLDGDGANAVTDIAGNKLAGSWTEGVSTFPTAGAAGSDFKYRFVVAVGDADRNGLVRNPDTNLVRANLFVDAGQAGYNIYADIDGNGVLRNADLNAVRSHLFTDPPAGPGPNRPLRGPNRGLDSQRTLGIASGYTPLATDPERHSVVHRRLLHVRATDILDSAFAEME